MSTAANKKVSENVSVPLVGYKNTNFCNGKVDVMYTAIGLLKGEEIKIDINQQSAAFKHLINFFKKICLNLNKKQLSKFIKINQ